MRGSASGQRLTLFWGVAISASTAVSSVAGGVCRHHRAWRHRTTVSLVTVMSAFVLSGCTESSRIPPPTPGTSSVRQPFGSAASSIPTSPSTPPPAPWPSGVPRSARHRTAIGARTYAEYYVRQLNAAGLRPRRGLLEPLALTSCTQCQNFAGSTEYLLSQGRHLTGPTFQIQRASVAASHLAGTRPRVVVAIAAHQPPIRVVNRRGRTVSRMPAAPGTLTVSVDWERQRWWVAQISGP